MSKRCCERRKPVRMAELGLLTFSAKSGSNTRLASFTYQSFSPIPSVWFLLKVAAQAEGPPYNAMAWSLRNMLFAASSYAGD
mmetsp:Transcript_1145/g.1525  ORF Transcript_1145/g.1525 Transcript_1145/m.1525 type:complete len:82 (+) Transcript_1145:63-308(+)